MNMEHNGALPDMRFRTFLSVETVTSDIQHYRHAPMKSFRTPVEWDLEKEDFKSMITLQYGVFYDTELPSRPKSYVIVPAELSPAVRFRTGVHLFTFINNEAYPCYPARSTIKSQIRVLQTDRAKCVVLMPIPNCSKEIPLTTLFHKAYLKVDVALELHEQNSRMWSWWFDSLPKAVQCYLEPIQREWSCNQAMVLADMTPGGGRCVECGQRDPVSIRRHFLRNHAKMGALYFCPLDGCPSIMPDEEGLRKHLQMATHKGQNALPGEIDNFMDHSTFWPLRKDIADAIMSCRQRLHGYGMLHSMA